MYLFARSSVTQLRPCWYLFSINLIFEFLKRQQLILSCQPTANIMGCKNVYGVLLHACLCWVCSPASEGLELLQCWSYMKGEKEEKNIISFVSSQVLIAVERTGEILCVLFHFRVPCKLLKMFVVLDMYCFFIKTPEL